MLSTSKHLVYIKQTMTYLKGEIDVNTIKFGDFNTPLSVMNTSSRQKVRKEQKSTTL